MNENKQALKDRKTLKDRFLEWKRKTFTKDNVKMFSVDIIFLVIACAVSAFAVVSVMVPNGLTTGGVTGIVRILQKFVDVDFSVLYYIGSGIILLLSLIFLGFREMRKIVILSLLYPTVIAIFEKFDFSLLSEKDLILAAIFCGVLMGISSGIVFWRGYSFAGADAVAKILKKHLFPQMSLSKLMLGIDGIIILSSALVYDRNIALYALVSQVISTRVIDMVLYGFETKIVQMEIITEKPEELKQYVIEELERGVSSEKVTGEYTKQTHKKLVVLCSPRESALIRKFLARHDRNAFVTLLRVDTVWGTGTGFKDIDKDS